MPDMRKIPDIKNREAEGKKTPDVPVIPNTDGIPPPPQHKIFLLTLATKLEFPAPPPLPDILGTQGYFLVLFLSFRVSKI
jgi:hypothetical protein